MNGFEFLTALAQLKVFPHNSLTIIVLTSSLQPEDKNRATLYPIAGYIEKPLSKAKIKAVLG